MARNAHRKAVRDLSKGGPGAQRFDERTDESVVRRIEDLDVDVLSGGMAADPNKGDAGAELAEDFGREFLVAATTGEDIGEIESAAAEALEREGLGFHEIETDNIEDLSDFAVAEDEGN